MDVRNHPASLLEIKTTNRKEEGENNPSVLTCRFQELMYQEARKGKEPVREGWRLKPSCFSSWTRLVRLQAREWRVFYNMRCLKDRVTGEELLLEEIEGAEEIISRSQSEAFPESKSTRHE